VSNALVEGLTLAPFCFHVQPEPELFLPGFKGAAFRGGFGYVFKSIACPTHDSDCIHARLGRPCIYAEVFETPVPPQSAVMRKYPRAPHPFVLTPPLDRRAHFTADDELRLELVLVGRAISWLAYFICTLEELGRRGIGPARSRYRITRVESLRSPAAEPTPVYDGLQRRVLAPPHIIRGSDFYSSSNGHSKLTLDFVTPARIVSQEHLANILPFPTLLRTLLRRIALLGYFHCGQPADVDSMRQLIGLAERVQIAESRLRWRDWERFSTRQRTRMKLGGLLGKITYEGELAPLLPFLRAGELVHVGKGTSFGLGKYVLV